MFFDRLDHSYTPDAVARACAAVLVVERECHDRGQALIQAGLLPMQQVMGMVGARGLAPSRLSDRFTSACSAEPLAGICGPTT